MTLNFFGFPKETLLALPTGRGLEWFFASLTLSVLAFVPSGEDIRFFSKPNQTPEEGGCGRLFKNGWPTPTKNGHKEQQNLSRWSAVIGQTHGLSFFRNDDVNLLMFAVSAREVGLGAGSFQSTREGAGAEHNHDGHVRGPIGVCGDVDDSDRFDLVDL